MMRYLLFAVGVLVGCAHVGRPAVTKSEHYVGDSVEATVVLTESDPRCLLLVTGPKASPLDGLVVPCTKEPDFTGNRLTYNTIYEGKVVGVLLAESPNDVSYTLTNNPFRLRSTGPATNQQLDALFTRWKDPNNVAAAAAFATKQPGVDRERAEQFVTDARERALEACAPFTVSVDWDSTTNVENLSFLCGAALEGLARRCSSGTLVHDKLAASVKAVRCAQGAEATSRYEVADGTLTTVFAAGLESATTVTDGVEAALGAGGTATPDRPWGRGESLDELTVLERTHVCRDAKGAVLAFLGDQHHSLIVYGTSAKLTPGPANWLGRDAVFFFDPRVKNPNPPRVEMEKIPAHFFNVLSFTPEKGCAMRCGTRVVTVPAVAPEAARSVLLTAEVGPRPFTRKPFALLRDSKGQYYYVDVGSEPGHERDYRLFMGPKGALKLVKMINVVDDSTGALFSTKKGDLRLLIDYERESQWIHGKKVTPLRRVPVEENFDVIFSELGVYAGQRLGTPCDDF